MPRSSAFLHNHILFFLFFSPAFNILVNVGVVLTYPILISIGTVLSVPGNAGIVIRSLVEREMWWHTAEALYCLNAQNLLPHISQTIPSHSPSTAAPGGGGCFS